MKKRKLINVIIICIIAILSLAGVIIHINNKRNFKSSNNEQYMAKIVMKGFELSIPDRYMATYDGDMGLMYWNNDHFDMMIDVEDGEYNEDIIDKLDEINRLMESELVVVRPYSEMTIDGKSYTYMLYYDAGIPTIHCYTMADDMHLYSVMVLCNEMSMIKPQTEQEIKEECEQLIKIADSIIRTSNPTDKPNSFASARDAKMLYILAYPNNLVVNVYFFLSFLFSWYSKKSTVSLDEYQLCLSIQYSIVLKSRCKQSFLISIVLPSLSTICSSISSKPREP